jgi:hypothetical protein
MELNFDYKEGCYLYSGTSFYEVVIHKTIYKLVTVVLQDFGDYKPFTVKVYDLTNKLDVEILNEKYTKIVAEDYSGKQYNILLGTIVEYDYLDLIFLRIVDKKILSFHLKRPLLFDYIKARDKYLVADSLDRVAFLQNEFNSSWEQYFRIPIESEDKIDWEIKSQPIPMKTKINESLLKDEFGHKDSEQITVYDFLSIIDTDTFNKIPNQEIKDEISNLIKKTLAIAKENEVIGKANPNKAIKLDPKKTKKAVEPIINTLDTNEGKTLYKIRYVLKALEKDGGDEYPHTEDFYSLTEQEALDKAERQINEDIKTSDLHLKSIEVIDRVPPINRALIEETFVKEKAKKPKRTQAEIISQVDEVDPEDLLSMLDEI